VRRAVDEAYEALAREPDALPCIVGPTASGKTALAVELCARLGGEIVSADSVQIYRRFDVGSGKPTPEERARAPHHLVDAIDPLDAVDAARFAALAEDAIADVRARGRRPVVCGGTFLWVRALLFGLAEAPRGDAAIRARHARIAEEHGRATLHAKLAEVDPPSAARLHPNDLVRVSRALEVHELAGAPLSALQAAHAFARPRHHAVMFALRHAPEELTSRIAARTAGWLAGGWVEEVRALRRDGYGEARAMRSVGYHEVAAHVDGALSHEALHEAIVRATRVFTRRQRTWLARAPVTWLDPSD